MSIQDYINKLTMQSGQAPQQFGNIQNLQKGLLSTSADNTANQMLGNSEQSLQQNMQASQNFQNQRDMQLASAQQQAGQQLQQQQQQNAANGAKLLKLGLTAATGGLSGGANELASQATGNALQKAAGNIGDYMLRGTANNLANSLIGTNGVNYFNKKFF